MLDRVTSLISALFSSPAVERPEDRLRKLLGVAADIADRNPHTLLTYVYLLGRKLQSAYLSKAVSMLNEHEMPDLEPKQVWFDDFTLLNASGTRLHDVMRPVDSQRKLHLARDLILPWPWNMQRLSTCLATIGTSDVPWKEDKNHRLQLWLPFGIAWVHSGNHSIATGIARGVGSITTTEVYDMSQLFELVRFDGENFVRNFDNRVISTPPDFEFAAIFEVGRMMHTRGICA